MSPHFTPKTQKTAYAQHFSKIHVVDWTDRNGLDFSSGGTGFEGLKNLILAVFWWNLAEDLMQNWQTFL